VVRLHAAGLTSIACVQAGRARLVVLLHGVPSQALPNGRQQASRCWAMAGTKGELVETRFPLQTEGRYSESLVESLAAQRGEWREASVRPPDSGAQTTDRHTASTHCLDTNHIICPPAQAAANPPCLHVMNGLRLGDALYTSDGAPSALAARMLP
jgi:hypothetical protein